MKPRLIIFIASLILFASCKKNGSNVNPSSKTPDIYVAGDDNYNAVYWKNGKEIILPLILSKDTITGAVANGIAVSGTGDVYVVGQGYNAKAEMIPLIWKNGILDTLPRLTESDHATTIASSITFSGNDIYVGGYQNINYSLSSATGILWKNGVPFSGGQNFREFSKLVLSNGEIYAPGATISNLNGIPTITENVLSPAGSYANDVFVSGSNVYLAGSIARANSNLNAPCYWKNGVANILTLTIFTALEDARSICVSDSGVYVTADDDVIWKNGIANYFVGSFSSCYYSRMAVFNKDVYVVGEVNENVSQYNFTNSATIWKNNVATILGGQHSDANDIYVQQ